MSVMLYTYVHMYVHMFTVASASTKTGEFLGLFSGSKILSLFLKYVRHCFPSLNLGGSSLTNIKMEVKAPRIHYVHPTYFEAGKPMEFVACGSNLNQPKFR